MNNVILVLIFKVNKKYVFLFVWYCIMRFSVFYIVAVYVSVCEEHKFIQLLVFMWGFITHSSKMRSPIFVTSSN